MIPLALIPSDHPMPCTFEDPHFQSNCTHRVISHGIVKNTIRPSDEPSRAPTRNTPSWEYFIRPYDPITILFGKTQKMLVSIHQQGVLTGMAATAGELFTDG
jgi:hypothetical protein